MPTLPKKCGPYISSVTSRGMNLVIRGIVLFFIGVFLALVLNLLQIQRNVTLFPPDVITSIFSSAWWVPPCCGTASGKFSYVFMPGMEIKDWIGSYSCKKLRLKGVENINFSSVTLPFLSYCYPDLTGYSQIVCMCPKNTVLLTHYTVILLAEYNLCFFFWEGGATCNFGADYRNMLYKQPMETAWKHQISAHCSLFLSTVNHPQ